MWAICLFQEKVQIKVECNCVYSTEKNGTETCWYSVLDPRDRKLLRGECVSEYLSLMATSLVGLPLPVFHFSFCALCALDVAKPHSTIQTWLRWSWTTLPSEGLQLPGFESTHLEVFWHCDFPASKHLCFIKRGRGGGHYTPPMNLMQPG